MDDSLLGKGLDSPVGGVNYDVSYLEGKNKEELLNIRNDIYNNMQNIVLNIYKDINDKKYIEPSALASLLGMGKDYSFVYGDHVEIKSDTELLQDIKDNGESPIYSEGRYPDFSSEYTYDKVLDMYEVSDEQIANLISIFERNNPGYKVSIKYDFLKVNDNISNTSISKEEAAIDLISKDNYFDENDIDNNIKHR